MEFTFTPTSTKPPAVSSSTATGSSPQIGITTISEQMVGAGVRAGQLNDSSYGRVSLTKEHGVGNTTQWRKRLITQIEDRIKDRRTSIHNARRSGLQSRSNALDPISSFAPVQAVVGESVSEISVIDEEEERRIVAEVWETFKDENFEALSQAFQGMTDKEIEGIEQDILLQRYTPEYDPTYDMVVDMEMQVMDQTIDRYMRLEKAYETIPQQGSDMAATISLAITLLSRGPCVRCRSGPLAFEPTVSQSQSEGIRSSCALCGFVLEKEALLHIANTAKSHSDNCAGQVQVAFDEEMGLLLFCTQCGLLA